jgi:hypothetical protein
MMMVQVFNVNLVIIHVDRVRMPHSVLTALLLYIVDLILQRDTVHAFNDTMTLAVVHSYALDVTQHVKLALIQQIAKLVL